MPIRVSTPRIASWGFILNLCIYTSSTRLTIINLDEYDLNNPRVPLQGAAALGRVPHHCRETSLDHRRFRTVIIEREVWNALSLSRTSKQRATVVASRARPASLTRGAVRLFASEAAPPRPLSLVSRAARRWGCCARGTPRARRSGPRACASASPPSRPRRARRRERETLGALQTERGGLPVSRGGRERLCLTSSDMPSSRMGTTVWSR